MAHIPYQHVVSFYHVCKKQHITSQRQRITSCFRKSRPLFPGHLPDPQTTTILFFVYYFCCRKTPSYTFGIFCLQWLLQLNPRVITDRPFCWGSSTAGGALSNLSRAICKAWPCRAWCFRIMEQILMTADWKVSFRYQMVLISPSPYVWQCYSSKMFWRSELKLTKGPLLLNSEGENSY